tara:strand:+ start:60641 stop:61552 length:912 start_codon:yes stop_codon:yes gene_type:complete
MPLMFPARHAESHAHGVDDVDRVREIVRRTLRDLSWTIEQQMADRIFAKTSASIWSLGENVEIEWRQEMHLSITSRCAVPTQCFDWGKNRENVAAFMSGFQNNVTLAIEAEAFSRDSHVESPEALRQPANTVASEAIGNASVECGQCRFKVLSEGRSGMFIVEPITGSGVARRKRKRQRSFQLTTGFTRSEHQFTALHGSVPLTNVSKILIQAGHEGRAGCGLAIMCLVLSCTVVGFILAVYLWQKASKGVTPAVTFFYDSATGNSEIDEYRMKTVDLEDANAADAVHSLLTRHTFIPTLYHQ